jgi:two-component system nitrate/nitrite response regulator NarL
MEAELRVLVVGEGLGLTQSLLLRLSRSFAVRVLGPVPAEAEALEAVDAGVVDLVLVDLVRTDGRAWDIISAIVDGADVRVLAVALAGGVEDSARALAAGATGVIRGEGGGARELAASLRRAAAGSLVLPDADLPSVVSQLRLHPPTIDERAHDLTARERQVLCALADGGSCADVAHALGISPLTVRSHVKNVMSKLGVHTKVEAVTFALRTGLAGDRRSA